MEAQLFNFVAEQRWQGTCKIMGIPAHSSSGHLGGSGKVKLDESIYLTYVVGWMSDQEINVFGLPAIGDDFLCIIYMMATLKKLQRT